MQTMYPAQANSPSTELESAIDDTQTTITVVDASVLPPAPNLLTIGAGEVAETIVYTGIDNNDLTGCVRGVDGEARAWSAGSKCARNFAAYDHEAFRANITELDTRVTTAQNTADNAETPEGAQAKVDALAGVGNTKTVKQLDDEVTAHLADYVRQPAFAVTSGTSTAYAVALDPAPVNLPEGFGITIVPHIDCGDEPTLEINGLGAVTLKDQKGSPYGAGKLVAGKPYTFRKVGTHFLADSGWEGGGEINGQAEETITFGEDIDAYDPILVNASFDKLPNPSTLPVGAGNIVAFSSDSTYLVVAFGSAPYIIIYKRYGDTFTALPAPSTLPTGSARSVVFSPDDNFLAVAHNGSPYITIYSRSGDTFTKLPNPSILPPANATTVAFSRNTGYLVVGFESSPLIYVYKISGSTFTKLANPSSLPPDLVNGAQFFSDDSHLVLAHNGSPYITIYSRSGDTFTKLAAPSSPPNGNGRAIAVSSDDRYVAMVTSSSPYLAIYKVESGVFTRLDNPEIIPSSAVYGITFSNDTKYLVVVGGSSPSIIIYRRSGDIFTKLPPPSTPLTSGSGVAFSHDDTYLAATHIVSPYVNIYKQTVAALKSESPRDWINGLRLGYAKESGLTGETKQVVITHH